MLPEQHELKWLLPLITVLVAIGCVERPKARSLATVQSQTISDNAESDLPPLNISTMTLTQLGFEDVDSRDAASRREWLSELIHDNTSHELKRLGKLLTTGKPVDLQAVASLVHDRFQCTTLRPNSLTRSFEDESFTIWKLDDSTLTLPFVNEGAAGLKQAIATLVEPANFSSAIESKFKTVRVDLNGDQCQTIVRYELRALGNDRTLQQNATWQCEWHLRDTAALPRDVHDSSKAASASDDFADTGKRPSTLRYETKLQSIRLLDFAEVVGPGTRRPMFDDLTQSILGHNRSYQDQLVFGLDYWLDRIESRFGINISGWQGISVADVNGDGLDDVYLCQGGGLPNRLFVQNPDGTATDRAAESQVDWRDHSYAAVFADLDNDGDQDLVLGTVLGIVVMANDGRGVFHPTAAKSIPEAAPLSLALADYDNDGDLDIFAACYSIRSADTQRSRFLGRPVPYHDANNGGRNVLFQNEGNWSFRDVTQSVGLGENNRRFSMAASWEDYDNDGDLDLYVANDYGRNNLYQNESGRFHDVAAMAGVEDISAGMSVSWGDFNADGHMDLYVSNMFSSAGNRIAYQRSFQPNASSDTRLAFQRHARGNSLFLNGGDGTFVDVSVPAGVTMGRWAWGSRFADINNDGWEDILVANGFITQENPDDL